MEEIRLALHNDAVALFILDNIVSTGIDCELVDMILIIGLGELRIINAFTEQFIL